MVSLAANTFYFFLDKKVTKDQVSREASLLHMACAAKPTEPGRKVLRLCFATLACASG